MQSLLEGSQLPSDWQALAGRSGTLYLVIICYWWLVRTVAAVPALADCAAFLVEATTVLASELALVMLAIADRTAAFAEEAWPAVLWASVLLAIAVCVAALAEEAAQVASKRASVMLALADCVPAFAEAACTPLL